MCTTGAARKYDSILTKKRGLPGSTTERRRSNVACEQLEGYKCSQAKCSSTTPFLKLGPIEEPSEKFGDGERAIGKLIGSIIICARIKACRDANCDFSAPATKLFLLGFDGLIAPSAR